MQDYSDLLFLIGAIAIYALLVNNTNNNLLRNDQMLTSTEMEYGAVSVAQDIVEEARWIKYNDATKSRLEQVNTDDNYDVEVTITGISLSNSDRPNKKIDIKVNSAYLGNGETPSSVTMSYIKTNYINN